MGSLRTPTILTPQRPDKFICPPAYHPISCVNNPSLVIKDNELDAWYDYYEQQPFNPLNGVSVWFLALAIGLIFNREIFKKSKETYEYVKPKAIKLSQDLYSLSLVYIDKIKKRLEKENLPQLENIHPYWLHKIVEYETERNLKVNPMIKWDDIERLIKINLKNNPDYYSFIKNKRK
jgi:hypothetical protein